jgi:hypothetical protein
MEQVTGAAALPCNQVNLSCILISISHQRHKTPSTFSNTRNSLAIKNLCDFAFSFPREQLVACAFHRPVKIDPESLSLWALIILSHPSAILWIISYEESALENLVRELDNRSLFGRCCKCDFKMMMMIVLHCPLCCFSTQANTFN